MKKFIMAIVCLMTMVISANAHNTHYPTYVIDGITYVTYIDQNGKILGCDILKVDKPNSRTVIVPSKITINGQEIGIGVIKENAFSTCVSLDSLIFSDGLTIGNWPNTFKGCRPLEYLYYSNGGYMGKANWLDGRGCYHDMEYGDLQCKTFETTLGCCEAPFWTAIKRSLEKIIIRETNRVYTLMDECQYLKTIVCYASNPPYTYAAHSPYVYICAGAYITFVERQWSTITLYVPTESLTNYYFDKVWGEIDNIYSIDEMKNESLSESDSNSATGASTSISPINNTNTDNVWYSLNGTKIDSPTKGIYIKNGKKYIIR
jgi:hypothetical protein